MSLIGDILADILSGGVTSEIGPSTSRGMMVLGLLLGLALCAGLGWLVMTAPDRLREPEWGFGVLAMGFIVGPAEMILSGVVISREPEERALAISTFVANAAALTLAVVAVL